MNALGGLQWMLPPLAICLVLTGIHGYLGIHVLARKVIFVDLALAQIAALGSVCAILLGYDARLPADGPAVYMFSLGFTLAGAAVFALTRMRKEKVPQEAFIGIAYAVASALAILFLARSPGEGEHIKEMLVGNVLLVTWPTVVKTAIIYGVIGLFHYLLRKPFFEISTDHDAAVAAGRRVVLWDFAFYASFGLVITSSVAVAGVLLVFSFLVVPAVIAFLWSTSLRTRIVLAWAVGIACSGVGMVLSYYGDLPTGPSVVACFAALLILSALTHHVVASTRRSLALARVLVGAAAVAGLIILLPHARKPPAEHLHESAFQSYATALAGNDENAQIEAIHHLVEQKDPHAVAMLAQALTRTSSDRVIEHILDSLPEFGEVGAEAVPAILDAAKRAGDLFLRLEAGTALLRLHQPHGFLVLQDLQAQEPPSLLQEKIAQLLTQMAGQDFGLAKADTPALRAQARAAFATWLHYKGQALRWRPDLQRFE
jgi:zinc/manganese transport system permease protein